MPKGFTEQEKKIIKDNLIEKGTDLFGTYGLKKTNVEEITSAVNIAKGSFYSFYSSKEELFLDILQRTEKKVIKEIQQLLKNMKKNPKGTFKDFIRFHFRVPKEQPIIQQIADKNTRDYLIRKLQNNPNLKQVMQTYEYIPQFIKMWQNSGFIIKKDPQILAGILKSLFTIGLDEETVVYIGKEKYPEIIETLIDIIADYMIISKSG